MKNLFKKSKSPVPSATSDDRRGNITFYQALKRVVEGRMATREGWENEEEYMFMRNEMLGIHREGKDFNYFNVREPDVIATDWYIVNG